jgi:hypothetical protein
MYARMCSDLASGLVLGGGCRRGRLSPVASSAVAHMEPSACSPARVLHFSLCVESLYGGAGPTSLSYLDVPRVSLVDALYSLAVVACA